MLLDENQAPALFQYHATTTANQSKAEINLAVNEMDEGDGVVVVTDLFGGTPSNLAINACQSGARKVIYGASLPLLVKLAKSRDIPLDDSVQCACEAGRKYMNSIEPFKKSED